jgi:hypothetical protein
MRMTFQSGLIFATARARIEETRVRRPYRPRFFAAFSKVAALAHKTRALEHLRSGHERRVSGA